MRGGGLASADGRALVLIATFICPRSFSAARISSNLANVCVFTLTSSTGENSEAFYGRCCVWLQPFSSVTNQSAPDEVINLPHNEPRADDGLRLPAE